MQTYGHYEFEELLKDEENQSCFDCDKSPAHWASVNNAVYLCLNCAGEHRGYGVSVSYIRSITIDSWNDNQVNIMRFGGNRNLRELLDVYQIEKKKIDKTVIYNGRLLDFYRKHLKSKVNKEKVDKEAPTKEEALKSLSVETNSNNISDSGKFASLNRSSNVTNKDRFKSISSKNLTQLTKDDSDSGFIGGLNTWMSKAVNSTMYIASKVGEMEITNTIITTGSAVAETGSNFVTKGTELSKSDKVTSFAKKANDSINFVINKLIGFGGIRKESKVLSVNDSCQKKDDADSETAKIDFNNQVTFEKGKK